MVLIFFFWTFHSIFFRIAHAKVEEVEVNGIMEQKPIHYDGSSQLGQATNEALGNDPFQLTDEWRINIGRNPYSLDTNE
jgi:hypothetical protein